jgi:hypothetical protein
MTVTARDIEPWEREPLAEAAPAIDALRRRCVECPPVRVLSAAASDALPSELEAAVTAHLGSCPTCRALLSDLERLDAPRLDHDEVNRIFERAVGGLRPASPKWGWRLWVSVSLATAAAIGLLVVLPARRPEPLPAAPVPTPTASVQTALPAPPLAVAAGPQLTKPAVKLTMLALTWRSARPSGAGFAEDIAPALNDFRADRFDQCQRRLVMLASRYPSSVEIPFYQGVSELFLGRPDDAVRTLRRARRLADETFEADASWYLGIALARSGRGVEARARFTALCKGASPYAAEACAAIR